MGRIQQKRRQITRMSMQRKLIISSFCFMLVAGGMFFSINVSNINESRASVEGDFRTISSGNWEDAAIWESYNGSKWIHIEKAPAAEINKIIIQKGTAVIVNSELTICNILVEKGASLSLKGAAFHLQKINSGSQMTVNGSIDLGTCLIDGNGAFNLNDDAHITISSPKGISKSSASGNIQVTGNRNFSKYASYTYRSPDKQFAGNGLPREVATLIIDNPFELELQNNLIVSSSLILKNGIVSTGVNILTLGTGETTAGTLTRESGSVKGIFKRWLGPGAMKEVLFPLSDGKNYNALFMNANKDDYQGGTITFTFSNGNNTASSTAAKTLLAGENGSYKVSTSDGFDLESGNVKMLSTAAIGKNENKSYWQLSAKRTPTPSTERNGTSEISVVNVSEIVVWPNPFKDNFTLKFNLAQSSEVSADLYSANGQLIKHELIMGEDIPIGIGTNEIQFNDVSSLAPGIYILNITEGGKLVTSKRVVKG